MEFRHQPVLLKEVLENLPAHRCFATSDAGGPKKIGIFVDGTLGGGGHTLAVANKFKTQNSKLKIIGIDQDIEAIFAAKKNLADFADQIEFVHDNFSNLPAILKAKNIDKVDAILLDLGVSSYQFDNPARGFSFRVDAPLDMRMNQKDDKTAGDIINFYDEKTLADLFYNFGGERNSRRIANEIVKRRPIKSTSDLAKIVENSFPPHYAKKYKIHPATRVFQALRIETNDELSILEKFIPAAAELLNSGGRLLIISFHSLEDRIVKRAFRDLENNFPDKYKVLTKKPIIAGDDEIAKNSRSRSAKLRVLEKIS